MPRAGCTSQSRASAQARGARDAGTSAPLQTGRGGGGGQPLQWPIWGLPPSPRFLCPHRRPSWRGHCLVLGDRCLDLRGRKAEATLGGHAEPWGGGTHREPLPYLVKSVAEGAGLAGVDPGPTAAPGQDQQPGTPAASGPPRREGTCQQREGFVGLGSLQHRARQAGTRALRRRQLPSGPPHQTPKMPRGPRPLSPEPCPRSLPAAGLTHSPVPPQH